MNIAKAGFFKWLITGAVQPDLRTGLKKIPGVIVGLTIAQQTGINQEDAAAAAKAELNKSFAVQLKLYPDT